MTTCLSTTTISADMDLKSSLRSNHSSLFLKRNSRNTSTLSLSFAWSLEHPLKSTNFREKNSLQQLSRHLKKCLLFSVPSSIGLSTQDKQKKVISVLLTSRSHLESQLTASHLWFKLSKSPIPWLPSVDPPKKLHVSPSTIRQLWVSCHNIPFIKTLMDISRLLCFISLILSH